MRWASLILALSLLAASLLVAWLGPIPSAPDLDTRTLMTAAAFVFAVFTYLQNARDRLDQARQQHTLKLLFDTRLSPEFRRHLENRKLYFREGQQVGAAEFWALLQPADSIDMSGDEAKRRRMCAESIRALLNYYEFVALGIHRKDLDGAMLKGALRTIMCSLVVDMKPIIDDYRVQNPRIYRNLVKLYMDWKSDHQPAFDPPPEI